MNIQEYWRFSVNLAISMRDSFLLSLRLLIRFFYYFKKIVLISVFYFINYYLEHSLIKY